MGSKGGGGYSTSGLEQATEQSIALQRQIYEQTQEDVQPWYQVGASGIGKLGDLLGLEGGSVQSRGQIYDDLLPQYTQQTTGATDQYIDPNTGQVVSIGDPDAFLRQHGGSAMDGRYSAPSGSGLNYYDTPEGAYERLGYEQYSPTTSTTDYNALNTAVEDRLSGQSRTPDGYGSLLQRFGADQFEEDAGYQYRKSEGETALERAMAAQGVTLGGGGVGEINPQVAKALQEQSQGMASQEYGAAYGRYNADQQNVYNRLMGVAGMGQGATGQLQQAGQSYAGNVGNLTTGLAGAQQNAAIAKASQPSMFGQVLQAGAAAAPLLFSDPKLKENIVKIGKEKGHNIYEFDYRDGSGRFRGVMADEVIDIEPDAVKVMSNGYLAVDYGKLGLEMVAV